MLLNGFSGRDARKLLVALLLAAICFGLAGILGMLFMQWLMRQNYAADSVAKHGISTKPSSRLGGVAIFVVTSVLMVGSSYFNPDAVLFKNASIYYFSVFLFVACFSLGLWDDLSIGGLRPKFRLVALFSVYAIVLIGVPELIPSSLGIAAVDSVMSLPVVGLLLTVIFCVGFLNAINIADGANGLVPGIALLSFYLFSLLDNSPVWSYLVIGFGIFLICNLILGRLFLGDAGAYGAACLLSFGGLLLVHKGQASPWLLAATLAYPCLEMLVSMGRRALLGNSMFLPDNHHLHNRLHMFFRRYLRGSGWPSAATGISITLATSGLSLALYYFTWLTPLDSRWLIVFCAQCLLYGLVYFQLNRVVKS